VIEGTSASMWRDLLRLRANPAYEVVSLDALPPSLADAAPDLRCTPDVYGVALPRSPGALAPKVVDCDTALLLLSLREPGPLPHFARVKLGHRADVVVESLVLEGVLELERGGGFVSGPSAVADAAADAGAGRLARLSHAALAYGAALPVDDAGVLARRLYLYNTAPLTPARQAALGDPAAVARRLGLGAGALHRTLAAAWWADAPPADGATRHWYVWHPRDAADRAPSAVGYKLYVSPSVEAVGDAFPLVVAALARRRPLPFKVGAHAHGLLRPDKLVIYLDRLEAVFELGDLLRHELRGVAAHGVPFTGPVGDAGLLSWGIDPPRVSWGRGEDARRSWRSRVTTRLAASLGAARAQGATPAAAARFAVERIRHAGVDPATWAPRSQEWEALDVDE
jgi:hypothetical protein